MPVGPEDIEAFREDNDACVILHDHTDTGERGEFHKVYAANSRPDARKDADWIGVVLRGHWTEARLQAYLHGPAFRNR